MVEQPTYDRIASLLGVSDPAKKAYLAEQLLDFEEIGRLTRTVRLSEPRSRLAIRATLAAKNPLFYVTRLTGPRQDALTFLRKDPVASLLLFHWAQLQWGWNAERHLGEDGDALEALAAEPDPQQAFRYAALAATKQLSGQALEGRGGPRRKPDEAIAIAAEHILDIYQTVTGKVPGVSVRPGTETPEEQIRGPAVEFLCGGLELMGFTISRGNVRLLIDGYRRRHNEPTD